MAKRKEIPEEALADPQKRREFSKGCANKKRFKSLIKALQMIEYQWRVHNNPLKWYNCEYCKGYHLTSRGMKKHGNETSSSNRR